MFQERVRRLVLSARQDPVSVVREAAIDAVLAFEKLEKLWRTAAKTIEVSPNQSLPTESVHKDDGLVSRSKEETAEDEAADVFAAEADADQSLPKDNGMGDLQFDEALDDQADVPEQVPEDTPAVVVTKQPTKANMSLLKDFMKARRALVSSKKHIRIPSISPPKPSRKKTEPSEEILPSSVSETITDEDEQDEEIVEEIPISRRDAVFEAVRCEEYDLAVRLCLLEDDATLLKRLLVCIGTPCMQSLSHVTRNALCVAYLPFLEDNGSYDQNADQIATISSASDVWLAISWLLDLAKVKRNVDQLDPRVLHELEQRLVWISESPCKTGLAAANVLYQLGL